MRNADKCENWNNSNKKKLILFFLTLNENYQHSSDNILTLPSQNKLRQLLIITSWQIITKKIGSTTEIVEMAL